MGLLNRWISWLWGYVIVQVTGESWERFMNLCGYYRWDAWDFCVDQQGMTMKVRISEYKKLRNAAKRTGVHLHILSKNGLLFWKRRYQYRYGFVVGLLAFAVILHTLCGRIWWVRIEGNTRLSNEQVIAMLGEVGIEAGVGKNQYDWASIRQKIMSDHSEIAWMSLNPQGTVLYVDVSETVPTPNMIDHEKPCHIKAKHDGRILSMQVYAGKAMVKPGDAVVQGDLLVSGVVEYKNGGTIFRHASAQIIAETKHTVTVALPRTQQMIYRTGKVTSKSVLRIFGFVVPLYLGSVKGSYEVEPTSLEVKVDEMTLPIGIDRAFFYQTAGKTVQLSEKQLMEQGRSKIDMYCQENLQDAEIKEIQVSTIMQRNQMVYTANIICEENISFEENMLIF